MKLQSELENLVNKIEDKKEAVVAYAADLKENGKYKNFEIRLAHDIIRALIGTQTTCEWYDKYNCNDDHITTLGRKALKITGVIS